MQLLTSGLLRTLLVNIHFDAMTSGFPFCLIFKHIQDLTNVHLPCPDPPGPSHCHRSPKGNNRLLAGFPASTLVSLVTLCFQLHSRLAHLCSKPYSVQNSVLYICVSFFVLHETSARAWYTGKTQRNRWRGRWEGGSGWGILVNPWLIHVNVWQKPLQYCEVISLQLIKINGEKKKPYSGFSMCEPLES